MSKGVLVGFDGPEGSGAALDWAAAEASARDVPLMICHVWSAGYTGLAPVSLAPLADAVAESLREAQERAEKVAPGVRVGTWSVSGLPTVGLLEAAAGAELVVLGPQGHGPVRELMTGSVSAAVAAHAGCPVVMVREGVGVPVEPGQGKVVVGYDGSPSSDRALAVALKEAKLRALPLTVICVWPASVAVGEAPFLDGEVVREAAERRFKEMVLVRTVAEPDVPVELRFLRGGPELLLFTEYGMRLLVVGTRGRGAAESHLLGSVGHMAVHDAPCPVMIVH